MTKLKYIVQLSITIIAIVSLIILQQSNIYNLDNLDSKLTIIITLLFFYTIFLAYQRILYIQKSHWLIIFAIIPYINLPFLIYLAFASDKKTNAEPVKS